ncbi:MAG: CpsB/CapC family capsule biosynthesis tyrosine phosphatase, partial [Candidatus Aminicenantes bacterium]
ARMVDAFVEGVDLTEGEVLDIDEEAFRDNRLEAQHYGFLLVPNVPLQLQPGKEGSHTTPDTLENKRDLAAAFVEGMDPACLYLLGPGTTVAAIAEALGVEKTLLGIDALYDGQVVGHDLNEKEILVQLEGHERRAIVVTPLGGNGFTFGRGNKPFPPEVIRRVGPEHIIVVATEEKARQVGGGFGRGARAAAELFLLNNLVHIIASDAHDPVQRTPVLSRAVEAAARIVGEPKARAMVTEIPRAILDNLALPDWGEPQNPLQRKTWTSRLLPGPRAATTQGPKQNTQKPFVFKINR